MVKTRDSPPRDSPTRPIKNIARKTDLNKLGPALKTKIELDSALPISDSSNQLSWRDARMESETGEGF